MFIFLISLGLILILVLVIPVKIKLKYKADYNLEKNDDLTGNILFNKGAGLSKNYALIHIFYFVPIAKLKLKKAKNKKREKKKAKLKSKIIWKGVISVISDFLKAVITYEKTNSFYFTPKDLEKLNKSLKYKKVDINFGINFYEPIINSYVIAFLNAAINMYIAKNINQFNLKNTSYNTYISSQIYDIKLDATISVSLIRILFIVAKFALKYFLIKRKVEKNIKNNSSRKLQTA